jgi:enoyl-CoA hydratase
MGGTQRLTSLIGKAKAMEMILTGRMIDASEAERLGIVARVVSADQLSIDAMAVAEKITGFSGPVVERAKRMVNDALETSLSDGVKRERQSFYNLFDLEDQKEGMTAFLEKRKAVFRHK